MLLLLSFTMHEILVKNVSLPRSFIRVCLCIFFFCLFSRLFYRLFANHIANTNMIIVYSFCYFFGSRTLILMCGAIRHSMHSKCCLCRINFSFTHIRRRRICKEQERQRKRLSDRVQTSIRNYKRWPGLLGYSAMPLMHARNHGIWYEPKRTRWCTIFAAN